jgi:hypothetical protein
MIRARLEYWDSISSDYRINDLGSHHLFTLFRFEDRQRYVRFIVETRSFDIFPRLITVEQQSSNSRGR